MIKLVIADDEYIVREGMSSLFDWEAMGIQLAGAAADGREAYELCKRVRPDLLISDICMPEMDCFELAKALEESGVTPKLIIISGVQDFQYAQSALQRRAYAYILKPVDIDEMERTVLKVIQDIQAENDSRAALSEARTALEENQRAAEDGFIRSWLNGTIAAEADLEEQIRRLNLPLVDGQWLRAAVIRAKDADDALARLRELMIERGNHGVCVSFPDKLIGLITPLSAEKTTALLRYVLELGEAAGVGCSVARAQDIPRSFVEANRALEFALFTGMSAVSLYSEIKSRIQIGDTQLLQQEDLFLQAIASGNTALAQSLAQKLMSAVENTSGCDYVHMRIYAARLLYIVERSDAKLEKSCFSSSFFHSVMDRLPKCVQTHEMYKLVLDMVQTVANGYARSIAESKMTLSERVRSLIDRRFSESIDAQMIARELNFSKGYISSCFHHEVGMSVNDYLTNTRMTHAKVLLRTTDQKISDISAACGYQDPNYFSRVFKRTQGMYPIQYRIQNSI